MCDDKKEYCLPPFLCRRGDIVAFCRETKPSLQGGGAGTVVLQMDFVALEGTGMPCIVAVGSGAMTPTWRSNGCIRKKRVWDTTNSNFNF